MILCVDIGNTSIKLARVGDGRAVSLQSVPSAATDRDIAKAVERAVRAGVTGAAVASVRPASTDNVLRAIKLQIQAEPLLVTHRVKLPVAIGTREPARVGVDRLCAACGAVRGRARDAIVVDAGSAVTIDLVLQRRFMGGLIMVGPQMMLSALHQFTAQLPDLQFDSAAGDRIDDTADAMLAGASIGAAGTIEAGVRFLQARIGRRPAVWLTGGHAPGLRRRLPKAWKYLPNLTLVGLAEIARANGIGDQSGL